LSVFFRQGTYVCDKVLRRFFSAKDKLAGKALSFLTSVCCFRQGFVVSDKRLSFPTRLCCFRQALVVSDKRFVEKSRVPKLDKTRDGIAQLCPRYSLRYNQKIGLKAHKKGQFTFTISRRSFEEHLFRPDLPIYKGFWNK
jgi:hypothetical protein